MNAPNPRDAINEIRRIDALRAEATDNITEQHLVSQAILRQFTDASRRLHPASVTDRHEVVRPIGPRGVGKVPNFVPQASRSAEELWGKTETLIPRVVRLCNQDRLHDFPDAVAVARDIVALHYVRNWNLLVVHARAYAQSRAEVRRRFRALPAYERAFLREYGVFPAGEEAAELFFDKLAQQHDADFQTGLMFRASVERGFERCREVLAKWDMEVLHPASGMFLIGDSPVISLDQLGRMGPLEGVALGDANQLFMPVGPRSLIAFGPAPAVGTVPEQIVEELNTFQVRAAREYVFVHPDSDLEEFVRTVRFGAASAGSADL